MSAEGILSDLANGSRPPVRWATYPGDCRGILDEGAKGPNTFGEPMWPVTADYDGKNTRVGFSYVSPPEVAAARSDAFFENRRATEAAYERASADARAYLGESS